MERFDHSLVSQQGGNPGRRTSLLYPRNYGGQAASLQDAQPRLYRRLGRLLMDDAIEKELHAVAPPERSGAKL
jgi:hypothetical protein